MPAGSISAVRAIDVSAVVSKTKIAVIILTEQYCGEPALLLPLRPAVGEQEELWCGRNAAELVSLI